MSCVRVNGPGPRRGFVCLDDEPHTDPNPACPNADQHTPQPSGYVAVSAWADDMLANHEQQQCSGCGLWVVWMPAAEREQP